MISELLKYARENPTSVIVALLAIIIAGGIAGGLYIQNLRSAIEERDKIITERMELIREQHRRDLRTLKQENSVLSEQTKIIERSSTDVSAILKAIGEIVNEIRAKGGLTPEAATRLEAATQSITKEANLLERALSRAHDVSSWSEVVMLQAASPALPPGEHVATSSQWIHIIWVAMGIGLLAGIVVLWRARIRPKE